MADKLINDLDPLTLSEANDDSRLLASGNSSTGQLYKITMAQAKELFKPVAYKYVASGSEGSTITVGALAGKDILAILRETGPIFEVASAPDPAEYTWDGTDIDLGTPVGGAGERFLILYTNS